MNRIKPATKTSVDVLKIKIPRGMESAFKDIAVWQYPHSVMIELEPGKIVQLSRRDARALAKFILKKSE